VMIYSRKDYIVKLDKLLGHEYSKNSKTIYQEIQDKQHIAMKNSKKLLERYAENYNPEKANPSTSRIELLQILQLLLMVRPIRLNTSISTLSSPLAIGSSPIGVLNFASGRPSDYINI
jgi:hypothetical protein